MLDTFISPPIMYSLHVHSIVLGLMNLTWPFMLDLPKGVLARAVNRRIDGGFRAPGCL